MVVRVYAELEFVAIDNPKLVEVELGPKGDTVSQDKRLLNELDIHPVILSISHNLMN